MVNNWHCSGFFNIGGFFHSHKAFFFICPSIQTANTVLYKQQLTHEIQSVLSSIHISCSVASMEGLMYPIFAIISVKETFLSNHPGATPAPPGLGPKPADGSSDPAGALLDSLHIPHSPRQNRFPHCFSYLSHNRVSDIHSRGSDICILKII